MYKTFTYFDGLGRPIQSQNRGAAIHGLSEWRDIVTLTSYNAQGVSHCTTAPFSKTHVPDSHLPAFYTALPCTSPSLDPTLTSYDNLARPLTITTPGGAVTSYSYAITNHITASGYTKLQRTQTTDPLNHLNSQFQLTWDILNRP